MTEYKIRIIRLVLLLALLLGLALIASHASGQILFQASTSTPYIYPTQLPIQDQLWCKSGYFEPFPYPAPGKPNGQLIYCWDATLTPRPVITLTPAPTYNGTQQAATITAGVLTSTVYDLTTTPHPPTATRTRTPTVTRTSTLEPSPTLEPEASLTPTRTASPTSSNTPTNTSTSTHTPTATYTLTFTPTPSFTPSPTPTETPKVFFIVDHNSIALFDQIPPQYREAAKNTRFLFSDRSVGDNISTSLDCLQAATWSSSPSHCRRDYTTPPTWRTFNQTDLINGVVPARIQFNPDPVLYNRANWRYVFEAGDYFYEITRYWLESIVTPNLNSADVFMQQFSYLAVAPGSQIADPNGGYFSRTNHTSWDITDYEAMIASHPDKTFVFSTTSLSRNTGTIEATQFNQLMRQYASDNGKILYDWADIESHANGGAPCSNGPYPNICSDYTTEFAGGHLGSVSAGQIAAAKTMWVLLAYVNGWRP